MAANNLIARGRALITHPRMRWARDPQLWVELFVTSNLLVLAADIYIAHSVNQFRKAAEYIPLYFSIAAPIALAIVIALRWIWRIHAPWRDIGYLVGWLAILVGLAGVLYHLESRFFLDRTLKSLTYAAPFAAPLSYTGLGFLLLVDRMVEVRTADWARWIIAMALGGFLGNFVLTLTDHAANGFFAQTEWIPVISSAFATGFLLVPLITNVTRRYLDLCLIVMILQALVGVLGFWLHLRANLIEPGASLWDRLVNGAPPMAPLLFPNLVGLALIGLWGLIPHVPEAPQGTSWLGATYAWAQPDNDE
ncbi:hypothetical protein [Occallatibacter riparius]|uniref:Uncharacterized protein n=1 Tax=Occallatibacter riparius TaxID=1002689 RepID=A0A9J7BPK8_9BACT|nr:hypothetical protein [Occallatibacter riparius]UWZ84820.1 hypothetical protein MOP44_02520 [Occallatibacter riparius]